MSRLPRHAREELVTEPMRGQDPRTQCPLCGYRFAGGVEACDRCGLSGGCGAFGCPHCGYQFPAESVTIAWFRTLFRRMLGDRTQRPIQGGRV